MGKITKNIREKVWNKYDCRCAYCGKPIEYKELQVDHIDPIFRNDNEKDLLRMKVSRGKDSIENFNPACRRCNHWKSTFTIDKFREQIELQLMRLKRDNTNYRMALDYGLLKEHPTPVKFYFETQKKNPDKDFGRRNFKP